MQSGFWFCTERTNWLDGSMIAKQKAHIWLRNDIMWKLRTLHFIGANVA